MSPVAGTATDAHWLLVKREWIPIEAALKQLSPLAENARDQIDQLRHELEESIIRDLHVLRMERNRVMHESIALRDAERWEQKALRVRSHLESLVAARSAPRQAPVHPSAPVPQARAPAGVPLSIGEMTLITVVVCAIWWGGSWYLRPVLEHGIGLVNTYSVAWWLLGLCWLLCWPGIILAYLAMGLGMALWWVATALFKLVVWLVTYVVTHPY